MPNIINYINDLDYIPDQIIKGGGVSTGNQRPLLSVYLYINCTAKLTSYSLSPLICFCLSIHCLMFLLELSLSNWLNVPTRLLIYTLPRHQCKFVTFYTNFTSPLLVTFTKTTQPEVWCYQCLPTTSRMNLRENMLLYGMPAIFNDTR